MDGRIRGFAYGPSLYSAQRGFGICRNPLALSEYVCRMSYVRT